MSSKSWLEPDPTEPWSFLNLSDAQRLSLSFIACCLIAIPLLWRGIPYWRDEVWVYERDSYTGKAIKDNQGNFVHGSDTKMVFRWFPILWPFKILTVLFHEASHAIVGLLTGGRVMYIRVSSIEGGVTAFDPDHPFWISGATSAGYIGSCVIGCCLIFAGFDALASKYAALVLGFCMLLAFIICAISVPKEFFRYQHRKMRMKLARWTCRRDRAAYHNEKAKGDEFGTHKEKMVSPYIIAMISLLTLGMMAISWYFADSIALRYLILFLGVMSATYAIWDVWTDGVINGEEGGSDCAAMAELYNKSLAEGRSNRCFNLLCCSVSNQKRSVKHYAIRWFAAQIIITLFVVVLALYVLRDSTAKQALRSRELLPTPNHYQPADLLEQAQSMGSTASSSVNDWWKSQGEGLTWDGIIGKT